MKYQDTMMKTIIHAVLLQFYWHCYVKHVDWCHLMIMIWTNGWQKLI
jgi:hypothetical protein